tara:strand:+ start:65 stop:415 length:351 start_codon:yes stop_codon:yes gene_type:complete
MHQNTQNCLYLFASLAPRASSHPARMQTCQVSTTKGTGGDLIILEEAAFVDSGFFYETVAPLLCIGNTSFVAISTLTSDMNFYTKLISKVWRRPLTFKILNLSALVSLTTKMPLLS